MFFIVFGLVFNLIHANANAASTCNTLLVRGPWKPIQNERMANLILDAGIDFKPGDKVMVRGENYQKPFMLDLVKILKKRGAGDVKTLFYPDHSQIKKAIEAGLSATQFAERIIKPALIPTLISEKYSNMRIMGSNAFGVPEGVDPKVFDEYNEAINRIVRPFLKFSSADGVPWTLIDLPTPLQAKLAIPEQKPRAAFKTFKKMVSNVFQLETENPSQFWIENAAKLEARAEKFNELKIKKLHYQADGTDLTVELHERAHWKGGRHFTANGKKSIANFPGFENFVTPKVYSAEGRVQAKRPVQVMGTIVVGAWFRFENGRVVEFGAEQGRDALERFFAEDPRNAFLGEVALVDNDSPVLAQKRLFYSIVFDENALSHIALGAGYAHTFTDPHPSNEVEYEAIEMNSPNTKGHIDFMIGAPDMNIEVTTYDGKKIKLMNQGKLF